MTQPPDDAALVARLRKREGKIDPCEYCFGVTRHDSDCRTVVDALTRAALEPSDKGVGR